MGGGDGCLVFMMLIIAATCCIWGGTGLVSGWNAEFHEVAGLEVSENRF